VVLPPTAAELKGKTVAFKEIMAAISAGNESAAKNLLQQCNDKYYGDGTSPLTDPEFDQCAAAYTAKFGLPLKTAPKVKAGARTDRHAGVPHDWPLMSGWLAKASGLDETHDWLGRAADDRHTGNLLGSPKWDGMSIVVTYSGTGHVQRALTRGDDGLGVDVTRLLAGECHFPGHDFEVPRFGVKYEVVMRWSDLERMNEELGTEYKNPRNTVAGIVGADDSAARRPFITLVPLDIEWDGCEMARDERIQFMQDLFCGQFDDQGEQIAPPLFSGNGDKETPFYWYQIDSWDGGDEAAGVVEVYEEIMSWRSSPDFDFMIDGVVFEFFQDYDIERLGGRTNDCPAYAIAAKFPSMVGRSKVVSIDFDTGGTGRRTPVVNYEPITLDGRTFSRTSISNMIRFDALNLCVGTPIIVEIRGDILGWIDRDGPDPAGATPIPVPNGLEFTYDKEGRRVFAYSEAPLEGRIERMMVKMGIKGIKIETIKKLVDAGLVNSLGDIFRLDETQVASVPGLGASSAEILCSALAKKVEESGFWDWEILASVGILNVGRTLSKETLKVAMLSEFLSASNPTGATDGSAIFSSLHAAIGPERCRMVMDGLVRHRDDILDLMSLCPVKDTKAAQVTVGDGPKYKVVVTGDLKHWERDVFKDYIETLGHKMVGSISGKTDYLITNTPNSGTVKNREAQAKGVPIITEEQAIEILGLTVPQGRSVQAPGGPKTASEYREVGLDEL
jgi:DNA ligase (NAD+)